MSWVVDNIRWIMLASGLLTTTMVYAAFAPGAAMRATFGEAVVDLGARVVVRNWGALIGLVGLMLVYGASVPEARPMALIVAGTSKLVFVTLVLAHGRRFLPTAGIAIAIDVVAILLFAAYLLATR